MICLQMGKTSKAKTPMGDFKITTPKNPLLSQQVVTSKGIPVPYNNLQLNPYPLQLNPYPNTWLCSDNLSFQCTAPNTWLINSMRRSQYVVFTPTWEGCWLQSSSVHQHDEDHEAPWLQNLMAYKRNSFFKRKMN